MITAGQLQTNSLNILGKNLSSRIIENYVDMVVNIVLRPDYPVGRVDDLQDLVLIRQKDRCWE